jgi:hypothetical protein
MIGLYSWGNLAFSVFSPVLSDIDGQGTTVTSEKQEIPLQNGDGNETDNLAGKDKIPLLRSKMKVGEQWGGYTGNTPRCVGGSETY